MNQDALWLTICERKSVHTNDIQYEYSRPGKESGESRTSESMETNGWTNARNDRITSKMHDDDQHTQSSFPFFLGSGRCSVLHKGEVKTIFLLSFGLTGLSIGPSIGPSMHVFIYVMVFLSVFFFSC